MKPGTRAPLKSTRLLDQMRERIRYCHYSLRTEQAYLFWVRRFIRFNRLRHPRDMGSAEVEAFLTHLATERHVAPSTHKQALAALLFLYRQVLNIELPWMQQIGRPKSPIRIPVVLSRVEVARLFERVEPMFASAVGLLYGEGSCRDAARAARPFVVQPARVFTCALGGGSRSADPRRLHAGCPRSKVSSCQRKRGLALGIPLPLALSRSALRHSPPTSSI
jgi:hypothetical protein